MSAGLPPGGERGAGRAPASPAPERACIGGGHRRRLWDAVLPGIRRPLSSPETPRRAAPAPGVPYPAGPPSPPSAGPCTRAPTKCGGPLLAWPPPERGGTASAPRREALRRHGKKSTAALDAFPKECRPLGAKMFGPRMFCPRIPGTNLPRPALPAWMSLPCTDTGRGGEEPAAPRLARAETPARAPRGRRRPPRAGKRREMFGRKGCRAARKSARVWLLGRDHPRADRSLKWDGSFGNLSDPDALIVDLTGLTKDVLQRIDKHNLDEASRSVMDKLLYGGTIVVITQPEFSICPNSPPTGRPAGAYGRDMVDPYTSNYHILPINVATTAVQTNHVIRAGGGHCFKGYIDAVKGYNFLINAVDDKIPPDPTGAPHASLRRLREWDITDNSGRALGLVLEVVEPDRRSRLRQAPGPGRLVLLPPPTEQIDEAIGRILSVYGKTVPAGRPVTQPAQREKAPGPTPAKNGDTAGRRPPLPARGAGQGGVADRGGASPSGAGGRPAAGGGGTDVFLSYHHEAKSSVAQPLAEGLGKRGVTVWWDSTATRISDTLSDKIREGLAGARCGVVIVSREYLDSGWGQTELGAMFLKNLLIFPVLHGVTAEEAQKKLPALLGKIMRSWNNSPESIMDEIADAIKEGRVDRADRADQGASTPGEPLQERGSPAIAAAARAIAAAARAMAAAARAMAAAARAPDEARPRTWGAIGPAPPPGRPAPGAERLLAGRKILSAKAGDFAQNAYFPYLYSPLSDDEKPVALFTLCPHYLGSVADVATQEFEEWVRSTANVRVDGRQVRVPGLATGVDIGVLLAVEPHPGTPAVDAALAYREFESHGFFEFGTSHFFFGRNGSGEMELDLCYMVGEFWSFLAQARLFHQRAGLDLPSTAYLSVRNSGSLHLGNYGGEAPWSGPAPGSSIPPTHHTNISLRYDLRSVRGAADEEIARAAMEVAKKVCNAYGETTPRCYNKDGSFPWGLWHAVARNAVRVDRA